MAQDDLAMWEGKKVVDPEGDKIGTVDDLFVDEDTRQPEWLYVDTGMFGKSVFVPAKDASFPDDDTVQVPFTKDQVKDAPDIDVGDTLSNEDERVLYDYYGVPASDQVSPTTLPEDTGEGRTQSMGENTAAQDLGEGRTMEDTAAQDVGEDRTMPVVQPGVEGDTGASGTYGGSGRERVRVKKRIVTEPKTVYVEREEIVVERQPSGGTQDTGSGQAGDVREEVLYEDEITPEHEVDPGEENVA